MGGLAGALVRSKRHAVAQPAAHQPSHPTLRQPSLRTYTSSGDHSLAVVTEWAGCDSTNNKRKETLHRTTANPRATRGTMGTMRTRHGGRTRKTKP